MLDTPTVLALRHESIELRPLKLRQFGGLLGVLPPALAQFFGSFDGFAQWARDQGLLNERSEVAISGRSMAPLVNELLARAATLPEVFDKLIEAMAIASGRDKEWVGELDLADALTLGTKLWELNADFFVRSVWPLVTKKLSSPASGKLSSVPQTPRQNGTSPAGRASFSG